MSDDTQSTAKMGRPTLYSQELATKVCTELATGKSMRTVCKPDDMPDMSSVFRWLAAYPDFCKQYTRAKEEAADALAEETLEIADSGENDWMASNDPDNPGYRFNGEHIQRSKLRVDTRKWYLSKIKPKKYGEKLQTELTGPDGGAIKTESTVTVDATKLTDEQLRALSSIKV